MHGAGSAAARDNDFGMGILEVGSEEVRGASQAEPDGQGLGVGFRAARGRGEGGDGRG